MKIAENNVKYGVIVIFYHKFYPKTTNILSNFDPAVRKKFVPGVGFLNEKYSGPGSVRGKGWLPVKVIPTLYPLPLLTSLLLTQPC